MIVDTSTSSENSLPKLARLVRSLRITKFEGKTSPKGYPQIAYQMEICAPESEVIDGKQVKVAGLVVSGQITFHGKNDMPGGELKAFCRACKAPDGVKIDTDNKAQLRSTFLGRGVRYEVYAESKPLTQPNENGDGTIVPVLGDDGMPIAKTQYRLGTMIGSDEKYSIPAVSMPF